jgi:hypothetical protein
MPHIAACPIRPGTIGYTGINQHTINKGRKMPIEQIIQELRSNICPGPICMDSNRRAADALERLQAFVKTIGGLEPYDYNTRQEALTKVNQLIILAGSLAKKKW